MPQIQGNLESSTIQFHHVDAAVVDSLNNKNVGLRLENLSRRRSCPHKKNLTALLAGFVSVTVVTLFIYLCGAALKGERAHHRVHTRNLADDETSSSSSVIYCEAGDESSPSASRGSSPTATQSPLSQPSAKRRKTEEQQGMSEAGTSSASLEVSLETGATRGSSAGESEATSHAMTSDVFAAAVGLLMLQYSTVDVHHPTSSEPERIIQPSSIPMTALPTAAISEGFPASPQGPQPEIQPLHQQPQTWKQSRDSSAACASQAVTTMTSEDISHSHSPPSADAGETSGSLEIVDPADVPSPGVTVEVISSDEVQIISSPVISIPRTIQFFEESTSDNDESTSSPDSPTLTADVSEPLEDVPPCSPLASTSSATQDPGSSPTASVQKPDSPPPSSPLEGPSTSAPPVAVGVDPPARQHPYYRLPRVDPSEQAKRRFNPILATSISVARKSITTVLQMMREMLLKDTLTSEDLDTVCKLTHQLAAHANFYESQSTKRSPRYAALPILARRFLLLDSLLCGLELLGEVAEGPWWDSVSGAINSDDSTPTQYTPVTDQALYNQDLSRRLCAALDLLKMGKRMPEVPTVLLKRMLFRSHLAPLAFWGPEWTPWRDDDREFDED